ncbi:TPA: RtcB family protein [Candidatus Woesearchaeota archaeon]|nr:RtcB family protein [Candidatus Woesearchaeota archaeon]
MKDKLQRINDYEWLLPKTAREGMNVDAKIFANQAVMDVMEDDAIRQLSNVAMLPGVVAPVCAMPDAHVGYGLPMGAVGAFDEQDGVISSGCTGFDINCGINMIRTNLKTSEVQAKMRELTATLFQNIPCGVGSKGKLRLQKDELDEVLLHGCEWAVKNGYGVKEDCMNTEENGKMSGADPSKVSDMAKKRGGPQLGTLGAGNHFLEVQRVDKTFDDKYAERYKLKPDQVVIMLHCGSRGLGHEVASDFLRVHEQAARKYNIALPDKQLVCAPTQSDEGQDYYKAMKCAVNYAFANRLVMTHWVRESFEKVFGRSWQDMDMQTIYAIAHNICKLETHVVDGEKRNLYVHRKGATRSYPDTPALIAGSMGTASYILHGTQLAMEKTFGSTCHGAGRAMSRAQAIHTFKGGEIKAQLADKGIIARATSPQVLAEEAPKAYKDIEIVIDTVQGAGISEKVARMTPLGVVKG